MQLGLFDLTATVGSGGMGEVWRGQHRLQGAPVAVKLLTDPAAKAGDYLAEFRREVQAIATLDHPGIVRVYDQGVVGTDDSARSDGRLPEGVPYLVMELANGGTLSQARKRLDWPRLRFVLASILEALGHAHARGVVHRDLKPGNVLITSRKDRALLLEDNRPWSQAEPRMGHASLKLTDFGVARSLKQYDPCATDNRVFGTPYYMAPEQVEGRWRDQGPWTDLYALGCLAFDLIEGHPPFHDESNMGLVMQRQRLAAIPPLVNTQHLPERFGAWLRGLTERRIAHRFLRAADALWSLLQLPLDKAKNKQRTSARPPSRRPLQAAACAEADTAQGMPSSALMHSTERLSPGPLAAEIRVSEITAAFDPLQARLALPQDWRKKDAARAAPPMIGAGLGLYGMRPPAMVGREPERDALWQALRAVTLEQRARLVLLRGHAGVGKTQLIRWLCEQAHELGAASVMKAHHAPVMGNRHGLSRMIAQHMQCVGLNHDPLIDRLFMIFGESPYAWSDAETHRLADLLAPKAVQGLKPGATQTQLRIPASPLERHAVMARFMRHRCDERPLILWLEDVQWGSDALGFAYFVLQSQRQQPMPVLLVLTVRDDLLGARPLESSLLTDLMQHPSALDLTLGPLPHADHARLIDQLLLLAPGLRRQVVERTQGNPLFATQLIGHWVERGWLERNEHHQFCLRQGLPDASLPDNIHQLWAERLDRLFNLFPNHQRDDARQALELAATLGLEIDRHEWRAVCGTRPSFSPEALVAALVSQQLAARGDLGWMFVHEMLRESLLRSAREASREQHNHRRAAALLLQCYANDPPGIAERRAHHLLCCQQTDAALSLLLEAAEQRQNSGDFLLALDLLRRREEVLLSLSPSPNDTRQPQGWLQIASASIKHGDLITAMEHLGRLQALPSTPEVAPLLAETSRLHGLLALKRGDIPAASSHYDAALHAFQRLGDPVGIARSLSGQGEVSRIRGDLTTALKRLDMAQHLFCEQDDLNHLAHNHLSLTRVHRRLIQRLQSALASAADNPTQAAEIQARLNNEVISARHHLHAALDCYQRTGNRKSTASCYNGLGELARACRDFDDARAHYLEAVQINESLASSDAATARLNLALVEIDLGNHTTARALLNRCLSEFEQAQRWGYAGCVHVLLLLCVSFARDWAACDRHLSAALTLLAQSPLVDEDIALAAEQAAEQAAHFGELTRADAAASLAAQQWDALGESMRAHSLRLRLRALHNQHNDHNAS